MVRPAMSALPATPAPWRPPLECTNRHENSRFIVSVPFMTSSSGAKGQASRAYEANQARQMKLRLLTWTSLSSTEPTRPSRMSWTTWTAYATGSSRAQRTGLCRLSAYTAAKKRRAEKCPQIHAIMDPDGAVLGRDIQTRGVLARVVQRQAHVAVVRRTSGRSSTTRRWSVPMNLRL